ncbi:iron ABC transporter permease [Marinococcus halophilus]|uniref:Putative ABC transporter permease protein YclN n=1 Tax=Marinococcus halophilus TaxID=1371 RepID=A0A510YAB2_MARHA|nr:ABC transporter permease [Marinococcus halophilus]OZT78916.1 iron ABC transporter permease [Marinococcus halophilus]GEK60083.1 putative ABC transporter permease protein YclN [Marinococcus halophilus]
MKWWYLLVLLVLLSAASLFIGVQTVSVQGLMAGNEDEWRTLTSSRVPRLLSIIMAGMGMAICGLIMQQLSRNRFVSPTTAGTMDSARFGILVAMIWFGGASPLLRTGVAFLFALIGTFIFMTILERVKFKDPIFIPLVGLMFGNIVGSVTTFFALKYDVVQNMSAWLQGDFSLIVNGQYELLYVSIPLILIAYIFAGRFTIAGMGEEFAVNLGLNYRTVVNLGITIVAAVTAVVILTVGTIPFLGLVVPNIVAIYLGDNLQKTLIHTALLGAVFVLVCDIFGRLIVFPYEVPIGLTVGVLGSFLFLYMLMRRKKYAF